MLSQQSKKSLTITGHRGAAGLAPENTLASIQKALDLNLPRIEIDVQQTKDNVVIVLHDETLDRTTNGNGAVKKYNYNEILRFNASVNFTNNNDSENEKIPTLEEVLHLIHGKSILVIEIKEGGDFYLEIEENVLKLIEKFNAKNWCIIHSFNDKVLEKIYKLNPRIILHKLLVWKFPYFPIYFDLGLKFGSLAKYKYASEISIEHRFLNKKAVVNEIHTLDKKVNVWTVNNEADMQKMIEMGVDGIITDYPDKLIEIIKTQNK